MSIILRAQKPVSGPMVACLVVLLKMASALCSAAVSGGTSWAPSGRSTTSISGSASMILVQSATSCLRDSCSSPVYGSTTWMPSPKLVKPTRPSSQHDVPGRVAAAHDDLGRRRADRVLDEVRRQAHHARLAIDLGAGRRRRSRWASSSSTKTPGASSTSSVARWISLELVVGEHLEPEAAALARSRARITDHGQPPAVRSLNLSTQLIGTSSTRAMLNLASIWLACHGWLIA